MQAFAPRVNDFKRHQNFIKFLFAKCTACNKSCILKEFLRESILKCHEPLHIIMQKSCFHHKALKFYYVNKDSTVKNSVT
jgi:hypothetical protein